MFVTKPRLFLAYVFENRFAVPSFNVSNLEMARAVIEAAELEDAPEHLATVKGCLLNLFPRRKTLPDEFKRGSYDFRCLLLPRGR
jgi:hypothetical protein